MKYTKQLRSDELLHGILENVVGFDVNPLAVLTARTNYLIALGSLIRHKRSPTITLPIFMADSIITPTIEGTTSKDFYNISTYEGVFTVPRKIVDSHKLEELLKLIEHVLDEDTPFDQEQFILYVKQRISCPESIIDGIKVFYQQLLDKHRNNKNRIWLKIILNSFAPIFFTERFDYVVGNPPWIKWEFLSNEYKTKLGRLYLEIYKLFSYKGMRAGIGFAHDDISIVFTYVAMDKYLKMGGKLGFLLKQTLWRSTAGKEFRKFKIEKERKISYSTESLSCP